MYLPVTIYSYLSIFHEGKTVKVRIPVATGVLSSTVNLIHLCMSCLTYSIVHFFIIWQALFIYTHTYISSFIPDLISTFLDSETLNLHGLSEVSSQEDHFERAYITAYTVLYCSNLSLLLMVQSSNFKSPSHECEEYLQSRSRINLHCSIS